MRICFWAQAKLYLSKIPMTAVDLLHDRVLPVYEQAGIVLERVLTDNRREYCGRPLAHPYELYVAVQQVEHRNTKVHSPQTNGFCERVHRTLKDEVSSVAYRKKIYGSLQELQEDLDTWLRFYNEHRSHQGTPFLTLLLAQDSGERPQQANSAYALRLQHSTPRICCPRALSPYQCAHH